MTESNIPFGPGRGKQRQPLPIGTQTRWGVIIDHYWLSGERFYSIEERFIDGIHGIRYVVSPVRAAVVEQSLPQDDAPEVDA